MSDSRSSTHEHRHVFTRGQEQAAASSSSSSRTTSSKSNGLATTPCRFFQRAQPAQTHGRSAAGDYLDAAAVPFVPGLALDHAARQSTPVAQSDRHGDKTSASHKGQTQDLLDYSCTVCYEVPTKFGLLESCSHVFCLTCIRAWRTEKNKTADQLGNEQGISNLKRCPACRVTSQFVYPSDLFYPNGEAKDAFIACYRERHKAIPCKHWSSPSWFCPFGRDCFYSHKSPSTGKEHVFDHSIADHITASRRARDQARLEAHLRRFYRAWRTGRLSREDQLAAGQLDFLGAAAAARQDGDDNEDDWDADEYDDESYAYTEDDEDFSEDDSFDEDDDVSGMILEFAYDAARRRAAGHTAHAHSMRPLFRAEEDEEDEEYQEALAYALRLSLEDEDGRDRANQPHGPGSSSSQVEQATVVSNTAPPSSSSMPRTSHGPVQTVGRGGGSRDRRHVRGLPAARRGITSSSTGAGRMGRERSVRTQDGQFVAYEPPARQSEPRR